MTNIDSSLRRPALPISEGGVVPDSLTLLEPAPQLNIDPGVSRPVFKFDDGDGLTDAFGNIYDGYGGAGGSTTLAQTTPPVSIDDEVDVSVDLDIIQYNASREKYEPKSRTAAGLAVVGGGAPLDKEFLQYVDANNQYEPKDHTEAGLAKVGGAPPTDNQFLRFNTLNNRYEPEDFVAPAPAPFTITDFLSGIIEKPQDRIYRIVQSLPFDITITTTTSSIVTGGAIVGFPSTAPISAGSPIDVTVSSTSVDAAFLRIQINYTRVLTP